MLTFAEGDRVEHGGRGRYAWRGTVVESRGNYIDVQWDHNPPGDIDIAVLTADVRPETTK